METANSFITGTLMESMSQVSLVFPGQDFVWAHSEVNFIFKSSQNEYRDLAKQCKQFASDLLDMCQTTDEVQTILTQEATTENESHANEGAIAIKKRPLSSLDKCKDFYLPRLELAIKYQQKQVRACVSK